VPTYTLPISHRPNREGEHGGGAHVPVFLAIEFLMHAYHRALTQWCGSALTAQEMVIVKVTGDFGREVFVGNAQFDVSIAALGTSSLTVSVSLSQGDVPAVGATLILVRVAPDRVHSQPFTDEQRSLLELARSSA
jgi:acyl-CoA thioesterase FadM